jgi:hypothetical protein
MAVKIRAKPAFSGPKPTIRLSNPLVAGPDRRRRDFPMRGAGGAEKTFG